MSRLSLLVADDIEMNRTVIRKFLKREFDVYEASNGREAMDIISSKPIDVVLLDIIMPEMDGIEVLERVRRNPEWDHIGILVATSVKEKTEREALECGADDVISKPYDPIIIKQRLGNILAKKHLEQVESATGDMSADNDLISREEGEKIKEGVDIIEKACSLIRQNLSNEKLVDEFAIQIREQTDIINGLLENKGMEE